MRIRKYSLILTFFLAVVATENILGQPGVLKVPSAMTYPDPADITAVKGLLGDEISSSRKGRLTSLPSWKNGELITIFSKDAKANHDKMDWYGEHGGKWLYTVAHAVRQSKDKPLEALMLKTADYLVSMQDADGYLGVYSPKIRITSETASQGRSWDAWNLGYMTLGLLAVHEYYPHPEYLNAAKKIGDLLVNTFGEGKHDITEYGTRHGLSATVILDPVVELYKTTRDKRYLDLALTIVKKMEAREGHKLIAVSLNGGDMEAVGDGKAYQILWNLTGLAKLYEVTANPDYLKAVTNAWQNIADYHLTITGGPWGGIGKHLECFNKKNFWSPYGFVETCSTMAWIQLNKEMLRLTGEAKYAQEIEKSTYNALLGARYANGADWTYHSFTNGSWHVAHFNDCCPSSGILALEELPALIYSKKGNGIAINLFTESEATLHVGNSNTVVISQKTQYPFDGKIQVTLSASKRESFPLQIRIPDWATTTSIRVNGKAVDIATLKKGNYFSIERIWQSNDVVSIEFPLELALQHQYEQADIPQGGGDIYRVDWMALTRGPLVFSANGLIDGEDREMIVPLVSKNVQEIFIPVTHSASQGPAFEVKTPGHQPLLFIPYYEAGDRKQGTWRLTWLQNKIN